MKILVLGASGLLGRALFSVLKKNFEVVGTFRKKSDGTLPSFFYVNDLLNLDCLKMCIREVEPDLVINCLSLRDVNSASFKNLKLTFTTFPQRLSALSVKHGFRLIQISSDAVFSGNKGNYSEKDIPDPIDDYGFCKFQGESISNNSLIIRTSMIGHSHNGQSGLLDWFINQKKCTLYKNAIFSGLPVYEISRIISEYFVTNQNINGVFHISSNPISKYDLLSLVKKIYKLKLDIDYDESYRIDRSLNSSKFRGLTGYKIKTWNDMINKMKIESFD